jgi:hypothetical protein
MPSNFADDLFSGKVPQGSANLLGDIVPTIATPVGVLHPAIDKGALYNINIFALNGFTNEKLEVRFNRDTGSWERQLTITRGIHQIRKQDWNQ